MGVLSTSQDVQKKSASFRLSQKVHNYLDVYAKKFRRKKTSVVEEALEDYFEKKEREEKDKELLEWQIQAVKEAKKDFEEGRFVDGPTAMKWFQSLGTDTPLPRPSCSL